jgi:hypothetical protein
MHSAQQQDHQEGKLAKRIAIAQQCDVLQGAAAWRFSHSNSRLQEIKQQYALTQLGCHC